MSYTGQPTVEPRYDNLQRILDGMDGATRTLALMYLTMLPPETIADIDAKIPRIVELETAGDDNGIMDLLMAFGADAETAQMLTDMRHGE